VACGPLGPWVGRFYTHLLSAFREREPILDLFNMVCGARMTHSYVRPAGVALDLPEEFLPACRYFLDVMPARIDEYETLLTTNEIFKARTVGVGLLPPHKPIDYPLSGPTLPASALTYDLPR